MALSFVDCKQPSNNALIKQLICEICENINIFVYIARIFDLHRNNNEEFLTQIEETIRITIGSVRPKLSTQKKSNLIAAMIKIYHQKNFSNLRSEILEQAVSRLGPFFINREKNRCYLEPTIYDGTYLVGESRNLCDSVFHQCDHKPMEFIECKANIASVVPGNSPFNEIRKEHQNKIKYLDHVHSYLTKKYNEPIILFACYNNNYQVRLNNVRENWGFKYMDFLGPMDIIRLDQSYN